MSYEEEVGKIIDSAISEDRKRRALIELSRDWDYSLWKLKNGYASFLDEKLGVSSVYEKIKQWEEKNKTIGEIAERLSKLSENQTTLRRLLSIMVEMNILAEKSNGDPVENFSDIVKERLRESTSDFSAVERIDTEVNTPE